MDTYEKKYKEALERAKDYYKANQKLGDSDENEVLSDIFPELKESSEEKVRKDIIKLVEFYYGSSLVFKHTVSKDEMLAWLEKQGKEKYLSEPIKDYQGSFACWNNAHDFRPKHLQRCICYDKYMKGIYCYVYDDISKYWCTQTTEEHDPDGDNHISDYADYRVPVWMPLPDISFYPLKSWLEKQGEQKSIDDLTPQETMDIAVAKCFEQGEQKPIDKIEPKFKVGDWVIWKNNTYLITANKYRYNTIDQKGYETNFEFGTLDEEGRLWDIKDAKDGDVLYLQHDGKEHMIIYKGVIKERLRTFISAYCAYNGIVDAFCFADVSRYADTAYGGIMPATKEQRDILFENMKEEGYEWDKNKKEVRKIEQNSAWSEEDEYHWMMCLECVEECAAQEREDFSKTIDWIKSIKEKMKKQ